MGTSLEEITSMHCRLCLKKCNNKDAPFQRYRNVYEQFYDVTVLEDVIPAKLCLACINYVVRLSCFHRRILKTQEQLIDEVTFKLKCRLCSIDCTKKDVDTLDALTVINSCTGLELLEEDAIGKVCTDCLIELETLNSCLQMWRCIENTLTAMNVDTDCQENNLNEIFLEVPNLEETQSEAILIEKVKKKAPRGTRRLAKKHICDECGFEAKNYGQYRRHVYYKHKALGPYTCDICEEKPQFKNKVYLKRHMERKHLPQKRVIECKLCGLKMKFHEELFYHRRRYHTDEKDYKHECPFCGRRFYKKSRLNDHVDTHTGIKRATCDICLYPFRTEYEVKQHKKTVHTDERNYICNLCGKAFACQDYLSGHMRCHERNYHCPVCSLSFTVPATLKGHVSKHHPEFKMPPMGTFLKNFDWSTYVAE